LIEAVVTQVPLPVQVMLRPRGGDFCYSDAEFDVLRRDLAVARSAGAAGVVFGILQPDGAIDRDRCEELLASSGSLDVTFHRAFDVTRDPFAALEDLIDLGVRRVLTSGQEASVFEGAELLAELVRRAAGRIVIMPGGGIRERNVKRIVALTGATELHVSASGPVASRMEFRNSRVPMGRELRAPEFSWNSVDSERVRNYRALIDTAS
jgi:copper homeostasis protein